MAAKSGKDGGILETVKTVVWALVIAGVFRTLFFQPFWIPSESMKETLLVGDFLFVNKMAYGYSKYSCPFGICPITGRILASEPERGDVVVFRHPVTGDDYIKRLIGLPGDTVQMRDGVIWLNGQEVPQTPAGTFEEVMEPQGPQGSRPMCANAPVGDGAMCTRPRFIETLPPTEAWPEGRQHVVLNVADGRFGDDTPVYSVPPGHYFFMGDNRDNSQDSRYSREVGGVGFVPAENLIGRADRVMFSSAGARMLYFWTWRADRFFKGIE